MVLVKIRTREMEAFTKHRNAVDNNIKVTREDVRGEAALLVCLSTHTDQYWTPITYRSTSWVSLEP